MVATLKRVPSALLIPGLPQQHTADDQMFALRPSDEAIRKHPNYFCLPPTTVVCLSQGPSLTVEHVENVVEMRRQSHHVLDSVPLLAGASRAEKSSAGDFAGVCNHARSVRERKNSSSPYRAL